MVCPSRAILALFSFINPIFAVIVPQRQLKQGEEQFADYFVADRQSPSSLFRGLTEIEKPTYKRLRKEGFKRREARSAAQQFGADWKAALKSLQLDKKTDQQQQHEVVVSKKNLDRRQVVRGLIRKEFAEEIALIAKKLIQSNVKDPLKWCQSTVKDQVSGDCDGKDQKQEDNK